MGKPLDLKEKTKLNNTLYWAVFLINGKKLAFST